MNTGVPTFAENKPHSVPCPVRSPFPAPVPNRGLCAAEPFWDLCPPSSMARPWGGEDTSHRARRQRQRHSDIGGVTSSSRVPAGKAEPAVPELPRSRSAPGGAAEAADPRQNFLQRHPALSRPTAAVPAPPAGWESGWNTLPLSTPSPTRGELGQLRCYQMCCEAGMWCGHIWRVCTASCCAAGAGKDQLCWAENPSPAGGGCAGSAWLCLFNTQTHPQLCLPSAAGTPSKGQPCRCGHTHSSRSLDAVPGGASPPK